MADANDLDTVARAFHVFRAEHERPTLILVHSHIGYGSPVEDSPKAHGEPLGVEGVKATKRFLGMPEDEDFYVPDGVYDRFAAGIGARGRRGRDGVGGACSTTYRASTRSSPTSSSACSAASCPTAGRRRCPPSRADAKGIATPRLVGSGAQRRRRRRCPWLVGGSADLSPSTKTNLTFDGAGDFQPDDRAGRNLHFGIREHASAAIANGMALTKLRPYWSGFLIFSDYARGAIRLSALMEIPVVHIFTHDSIGVGEDGPTHQPVEQLASLRAVPGLLVFRPADANEVVETWRLRDRACTASPRCWCCPVRPCRPWTAPSWRRRRVSRRAPTCWPTRERRTPDVILMATGSEVGLALDARDELAARRASAPGW